MKIIVQPSDNIFAELGNNTYDYKDLLSELIDNSIAARIPGEPVHVKIEIYVDRNTRPTKFVITDDAAGIAPERIGLAITPAGLQTAGSLNEHGLGMKQAIAALGKLESLVTKTAENEKALSVNEFRFGEIDAEEVDFDRPYGTTISIIDSRPIVVTHAAIMTRSIIPYLGARYRRFLRPERVAITLTVEIINAETGISQYRWDTQEVKPSYFHPGTRENRPVISKYPLEGRGWKAELTFGYAPKGDEEYEELGLDAPNESVARTAHLRLETKCDLIDLLDWYHRRSNGIQAPTGC